MLAQHIFILVEPSHPGNVGAVARAIKNMGFHELRLVNPQCEIDEVAIARASGAADILKKAGFFLDLPSALTDCQQSFALRGRKAALEWPSFELKQAVQHVQASSKKQPQQHYAWVFGPERTGLSNKDLQYCHYHVNIDASSEYASLNLAQAVQVVAYQLRSGLFEASQDVATLKAVETRQLAKHGEIERFFEHLEQTLFKTRFINPAEPKQIMAKLRRLFLKANLLQEEVDLLRGILTSIEKADLS